MAYKPPKQTIVDNDLKNVPSNEAVFEALKLKLPKPSVDGTTGQLLARGASADDTSWVNPPSALPSQTGNLDKVLVTDGSNASWQYAGLGSGSFGTANTVLGKAKPTGLTGTNNIIIGQGTTGDSISDKSYAILIGNNTAGSSQDSYSIRIGHGITGNFANGVTIGNNAIGNGNSVTIGNSASSNNFCVVIGHSSLSIDDNATVIGYNALGSTNGTVVGTEASRFNLGSSNVAIGLRALKGSSGLSTGGSNVAIGYQAGFAITTGASSVFLGASSATAVTTTSFHIALGASTVVSGNYASAVGYSATASAAEATSLGALASASTQYAIGIGVQANANGGGAISIGSLGSNASGTGAIAIGTAATATASGAIQIGRGGTANVANAFGLGGEGYGINTLYLGKGTGTALITPLAVKIMTQRTQGTDSDMSTGTLTLAGSQSTGNKAGGDVYIATAPAGVSGTTLNSHVNRVQVTAAGNVKVLTGDLSIDTVGKGLAIKSGTNAKIGTAQFTAQQTVTVNTTAVTANSLIFVAGQDGTDAFAVQNKIAGTSFEIHHPAGNATALVAWMIVEATP